MVSKYGDIIYSDGTIQREQIWTFDNVVEMLDYREQLLLTKEENQKMTCHLDTFKIEITDYFKFEKDMIGVQFTYPDDLMEVVE
tara:strand:+ start:53 stop:304 length:252 start_codon:yes stop_codon:yes gene_type:complete